MADIYSALIGAAPSSQEKQQAIADILRRKGALGMVGQLSGDPVLSQVGAGMQKEAGAQAAQLQEGAQFGQQFGLEQQREGRLNTNAQTGFDLQRRGLDLTERGQNLDHIEALARMASAKEAATAKAGKLTEGQAAAQGYLGRMRAAESAITKASFKPGVKDYAAGEYLYGSSGPLTGVIANQMMSKQSQQYFQSAADWVRAKLRKESGAVIRPEEMASEIRTYFPLPNDTPELVAQKAQARKQAEAQLEVMGGGQVQAAPAATGGGLTPQQQQRLQELRAKYGK